MPARRRRRRLCASLPKRPACRALRQISSSLGTVAPEPGIIKGRLALFVARDCTGSTRVDAAELGMLSVRLLTRGELDAEIGAERLQDAVTLLLLCRHRALKEV